jgi:large subunit ribosomal protein L18
MDINKIKQLKRTRRRTKIRKKISGTGECPRLSVFRSNSGLFLQIIDDSKGKTIMSADSKEIKVKGTKMEISLALGKLIAEKALAKNIKQIVFDRGGYRFHGRVKAVADGAREVGLEF